MLYLCLNCQQSCELRLRPGALSSPAKWTSSSRTSLMHWLASSPMFPPQVSSIVYLSFWGVMARRVSCVTYGTNFGPLCLWTVLTLQPYGVKLWHWWCWSRLYTLNYFVVWSHGQVTAPSVSRCKPHTPVWSVLSVVVPMTLWVKYVS